MNTQEIKEYEYQILMSVNNNFDTKLKEAEVEGWETNMSQKSLRMTLMSFTESSLNN